MCQMASWLIGKRTKRIGFSLRSSSSFHSPWSVSRAGLRSTSLTSEAEPTTGSICNHVGVRQSPGNGLLGAVGASVLKISHRYQKRDEESSNLLDRSHWHGIHVDFGKAHGWI